jgi:hypothetical protein
MSNVFANGLEISGKAVDAKTIAAFPDTCFTPPENPATPPGVPIPYPSFGFASDTEAGTGTVKIGGQTINIKNKSDLTKTSGTEAGCAAKKGIITSNNTGKEYFNSWSPNVKADGEPVIRFTDLATNNHGSTIANTPPWLHVCKANPGWTPTCQKLYEDYLFMYKPNKCAKGYEPHHIIDNCAFVRAGARASTKKSFKSAKKMAARVWKKLKNIFQSGSPHPGRNYNEDDAPCICLKDNMDHGEQHKVAHDVTRAEAKKANVKAKGGKWKYSQARAAGIKSVKKAANLTDAQAECIKIVLDSYYKDQMGCTDSTEVGGPETSAPTATSFATGHGGNANVSAVPS